MFGKEWNTLLKEFIVSSQWEEIKHKVKIERRNYLVYPLQREFYLMFKIFKDLQPSRIKVVILGQDPYHDGSFDGYAFSNGRKDKVKDISPSLRNILKKINKGRPIQVKDMNLEHLVKQGVFLVNSFLTVRRGVAGKHDFWKPFTIYWIKELSKNYKNIVWLMWGVKAQDYIQYIENGKILISSHPSPLSHNRSGKNFPSFKDYDCFLEANKLLKKNNIKQIKWQKS